jgi:hypothetical protein
MIDPPSGWQYGFPKPIPEDRRQDVNAWLVEQGYPQKLIDAFGEHFYCRYWEEEKAIVKFNGGKGALLCSKCSAIVKVGSEFNDKESKYVKGEIDYLPPQYCDKCRQVIS